MTSPVNNQPRPDPRWAQAQAERKIGDQHDRKSSYHAMRMLDAIGDKHAGSFIEGAKGSIKESTNSRRHYSRANRLENDALRASCEEHKCTIL